LTITKKRYVESIIEKHHRRIYLFRKFHRVLIFLELGKFIFLVLKITRKYSLNMCVCIPTSKKNINFMH